MTNKKWQPLLRLGVILAWNQTVYYGARVLNQLLGRRYLDMTTWLDRLIPLAPPWLGVYFLCYLFWGVCYWRVLRGEPANAERLFRADLLAKAICLVIFLALPTTNQRPEIIGTGFWEEGMRLLYRIDRADNLFPSIHCLVSWLCFTSVRSSRASLPVKGAVLAGAVLVCLSTLFTCQHVLADAAAGIFIAELSWKIAASSKNNL